MVEGLITVIIGIVYIIYKLQKENPCHVSGTGSYVFGFFMACIFPLLVLHGLEQGDPFSKANTVVAVLLLIYVCTVTTGFFLWFFGVIDIFDSHEDKVRKVKSGYEQAICDLLLSLPKPSFEYLVKYYPSKGYAYPYDSLVRHWRVEQFDRIDKEILSLPTPEKEALVSYRNSLGRRWKRRSDEEVIWHWRTGKIVMVTRPIYEEHAANGIIQLSADQWTT